MLNRLGVCKGVYATRTCIEQVQASVKSTIDEWKSKMADIDEPQRQSLRSTSTKVDPGFSFVWDNTQVEIKARHQCRTRKNEMKTWALCLAVKNRVPFEGSDKKPISWYEMVC